MRFGRKRYLGLHQYFMQQIEWKTWLERYDSEAELSAPEQQLVESARKATYQSHAPYSHFHVGAAILLENGQVFTAGNQENAAYPNGSCAETSVIHWVGANFPSVKMLAIAIVARPGEDNIFKAVAPCGICRQAMLEYEVRQHQPIRVLMLGTDEEIIVSASVANLLPIQFDASGLH